MKRTMMRIPVMFILTMALAIHCSHALGLPDDALGLLAEASVDPCSICVKQKLARAFKIMNDRFIPGGVMETDEACRLVKTVSGDDNELSLSCYPSDALITSIKEDEQLPQVVFRFYTPQKRLVGISKTDYTDNSTEDLFHASKPGTVFTGQIKLIMYKYGDGPTYNYFYETNKLLIHCRVLQLIPMLSK
jgi:hypothetical protein